MEASIKLEVGLELQSTWENLKQSDEALFFNQ